MVQVVLGEALFKSSKAPSGQRTCVCGAKREKKVKEGKGTRIFDLVTLSHKNPHFFYIPFKYWSYILGAIGIIVLLSQLRK